MAVSRRARASLDLVQLGKLQRQTGLFAVWISEAQISYLLPLAKQVKFIGRGFPGKGAGQGHR